MSDQLSNPMSPTEEAQAAALIQQLAAANPKLREFMAKQAEDRQRVVLPVPYWSVVEFAGTPNAGAITIDQNTRRAFQYAQGQNMSVAGAPTRTATYADTNLQRQGETLSNADVWIYGLCIEIEPGSDPLILEALFDDAFVEISTDGQNSIRLGTLDMFPAAGGLYGAGQSAAVLPDVNTSGILDGGPGATKSYLANGNPIASGFTKFPQPFKWGGVGQGGADASLTIGVTLARAKTITFPAARAAGAGGVAPGGYTPPAAAGDPGTWARLRIRLVAQSVNRRSANT